MSEINTPASRDYQDRAATAEDLIKAAEGAGVDILAVTDHNSASWIDRMRIAAEGSPVCIIPGVEITTPEGHILALFEMDWPSDRIEELLIAVGIQRQAHGKEEAISTDHAEAVIRRVAALGGLSIAAHANSDNGLLKSKGQYKIVTVRLEELTALELTKEDEIEKFSTGKVSEDYLPKACTRGSDSHKLGDIGRRVTYLKMHRAGLRGIRHALVDHPVRVRFPWNHRAPTHPRILNLIVDQGFFGGQRFDFHENLNCLVGGQGTGKSTVIEILRHAFGDISQIERIRDDHSGKIEALVGLGATIAVEYVDADGEPKIVSKEVQPWDTDSVVKNSEGSIVSLVTAPSFFSQGELVQIAASPIAQLELLDNRLDLSAEQHRESLVIEALRANSQELCECRRRVPELRAQTDDPKMGIVARERDAEALQKKLKEPILKEFPLWETEQTFLVHVRESLTKLQSETEESLDGIGTAELIPSLPEGTPNAKLLKELAEIPATAARGLAEAKKVILKAVNDLQRKLDSISEKLGPLFATKREEHTRVLAALGTADVRKASASLRQVTNRLAELRAFGAEVKTLMKREREAVKKRRELIAALEEVRHRRWEKRLARAKELESALGDTVRLGVRRGSDRSAYLRKLRELVQGSYVRDSQLSGLAQSLEPAEFVAHVLGCDVNTLARTGGISEAQAGKLIEALGARELKELHELEVIEISDEPDFRYVVAPGRDRPLEKLSTGQKGTVVLSLAMVEGEGPLVIDHPEEPLDTRYIYDRIVQQVRRGKEARQFLFTTHNANIAVGGDAELSHVLDADADKGMIEASGGVDDGPTNKLLLVHLEGGADALRLRTSKYRE